ncbi:hypothetical protein PRIPAC_94092 [Pristionchus pacificus]|uniref:Uncharacterized protein n=1 Tax=Pristionchus pacificus TaxID=54126 RepID=A0A2A6BPV8_PRIPA|nr:hypothetical protein PRIPAC_94092 [Pristionchus pacificus]|eukprot:PDM67801.1 hypothetical protein PRIPAC_45845 [Pristionchus pacificus]
MHRHESGEVDVLISEGRSQRIVPLKEAHDIAGFGLVQFLADRFQFQA